jgi:hypothetical protein
LIMKTLPNSEYLTSANTISHLQFLADCIRVESSSQIFSKWNCRIDQTLTWQRVRLINCTSTLACLLAHIMFCVYTMKQPIEIEKNEMHMR